MAMKKYEKEAIQSQLKDEEKALKELKRAYKKAKTDVQAQIKALNARSDMQNISSIVHQKRYQEAILKQIDGVLDDLNKNQYKTMNDFMNGSYSTGYISNLYSLQKQTGCTILTPIDPKKVKRAVETDAQLSKKYYQDRTLPENLTTLKRNIQREITRGIVAEKSWIEVAYQVASGMNSPFKKAMSDAMRIVRTEGHRINQQGFLDAGDEAIKHGADELKQWDATLDGVTRPWHREADGQIVEWNDYFMVNGEKMKAPSIGGSASNVINCRCQLLQRARWALDEDELKTLQERAKYFNLDKSKNFEDFKNKFLSVPTPEELRSQISKVNKEYEKLNSAFQEWSDGVSYDHFYDDISSMEEFFDLDDPDERDMYNHLKEIESKIKPVIAKRKELQDKLSAIVGKEVKKEVKKKVVKKAVTETVKKEAEKNVVEHSKAFNQVLNSCKINKVMYLPPKKLDSIPTDSQIIEKISGGDKTEGSCVSMSIAYIANKLGIDVKDFRGGDSQSVFATHFNNMQFLNMNNVKGVMKKVKSEIKGTLEVMGSMETGKNYWLLTGRHSSIVRRISDNEYEYLELQSGRENENGWTNFNRYGSIGATLNKRFGCTKKARTFHGRAYESDVILMDVDSFKDCDEFKDLLGYINTATSLQQKGVTGHVK